MNALATHNEAQLLRWQLADAYETRDFMRDAFEGWPSDDSAGAVRTAEDRVEALQARLEEWVV